MLNYYINIIYFLVAKNYDNSISNYLFPRKCYNMFYVGIKFVFTLTILMYYTFICFEFKSVIKLQAQQKEIIFREAAGLDSITTGPQGF